jgi:hypothetical protein
MKTIETTATVDEDLGHLTLKIPLTTRPIGEVRVIVQFETPETLAKKKVDWSKAVGSYYRENPDAPKMTTAEWMEELRGGEKDEENGVGR